MLVGPTAELLRRMGYIRATRDNAAAALRAGAVVIAFPGGDCDAYRPTWSRNIIDFCGRTGRVLHRASQAVREQSGELCRILECAALGEKGRAVQ